ncbi:RidA family protein [Actinomadura sp. 9N215]|uniref:RidA family protein n=1 Tax=Actinomadura sp. 9N215 TaxID=3375150 RepID=UPI003793C346
MKITRYNPRAVFAPAGGYSMGLEVAGYDRLLFISGQVPTGLDGIVPAGFEAQCEQAWQNVLEVLTSAGLGVGHLVKVTTFLTDKRQAAANRAIRTRFLGDARPASTVMIAETLDSEWLLEIEAVAAK